MNKLVFPVLLIFVLSFALMASSDPIQDTQSQIQTYSAKMNSIANYGKTLQKKLAAAKKKRSKKQIAIINKQIAALKKQKVTTQTELLALKEKLAELEAAKAADDQRKLTQVTPTPMPIPTTPIQKPTQKTEASAWSGFSVDAGYGGGAGGLNLGYQVPMVYDLGLKTSALFYMGSEYTVMGAQIAVKKDFDDNFVSLNVDWANYSESVMEIPGLTGTIEKGSVIGFGATIGRSFTLMNYKLIGSIGYSTALGATAGLGVQF